MDSGLRNWAIVGLVFVLGVLAAKAKEWLGNGIQRLGEQIYRRLAGSALLRKTALRRYTRELIKRHAKFVVSFRMDDPLRMDTGAVYVPLRGSLSGRHPLQEVAASIRAERLSLVHGVPGAGNSSCTASTANPSPCTSR